MKSWLLQSERLMQGWISLSLSGGFKIFLHAVATCTVIFTPLVEMNWWQCVYHLFTLLTPDARACISVKQPVKTLLFG